MTNEQKTTEVKAILEMQHRQALLRFNSATEQFLKDVKVNPAFAIEQSEDLIRLQESYVQIERIKKGFDAKSTDAEKIEFLREYLERFEAILLSNIGGSNSSNQLKNACDAIKLDAHANFLRRVIVKGTFSQIVEIISK